MTIENPEADSIGDKIPLHVLLGCSPKVSFGMDQWVVCFIECEHGRFKGVSNGLNMEQAFDRTVVKVIEAHPRCNITYQSPYSKKEIVMESCDRIPGHEGNHESY